MWKINWAAEKGVKMKKTFLLGAIVAGLIYGAATMAQNFGKGLASAHNAQMQVAGFNIKGK